MLTSKRVFRKAYELLIFKEIKQQTAPVEPKKDRKFSFLSEDELMKMRAEEAARIASMTKLDLETLDSLTSQLRSVFEHLVCWVVVIYDPPHALDA